MKGKLFFAVLIGSILFMSSATVAAKDYFSGTGQLQVPFVRSVGEAKAGAATAKFHASATAFMDFGSGNSLLFGYFGPRFDTKFVNVYILGGTFLSPKGGMSALASVWLEAPNFFTDKLYAFVEFDTYFPIPTDGDGAHTDRTYYVWAALNGRTSERTQVGVLTEHLFTAEDYIESAVGPAFSIDNITFWAAWDFTPADPDNGLFIFRVIYMP